MADEKDDGPAFPQSDLSGYGIGPEHPVTGMSLRDWFAGQALAGLLVNQSSAHAVDAAAWAYGRADAMLAERDKPVEA